MKTSPEFYTNAPAKVFFKLTILGCFLLGSAYAFLLLFNTALKAFH
jgi:hypothetical protein